MAKQFFPGQNELQQEQLNSFLKNFNIKTNETSTSKDEIKSSNINSREKNFSNSLNYGETDELDEGELNLLEKLRKNDLFSNMNETTEEYEFKNKENIYKDNLKSYELGVELSKKGDLMKAILAFEAEVQRNPKNANAWRLLGKIHTECDDDDSAICALRQAVNLDPNNLNALLDLSCSYTNELNKSRALKNLRNWLSKHPTLGNLVTKNEKELNEMNYLEYQQHVIDLFVKAGKKSPNDPDVFHALGVLLNNSEDSDGAIAAFQRATKLSPNDHSLWNKLGATMANNQRSKDAVDCYKKALAIKPNYVRAWVNLGIAFANQKMHKESVKYYIRSLRMNPSADHIWQYLGMSFYCLKRNDLVKKCRYKDISMFNDF